MKDKYYKKFLLTLGIWWGLTFFIIFLQAFFMSQMKVFILIAILFVPLILWLHLLMYKKRNSKITKTILIIYATIHFIPITLQLLGFKEPGIDNLITSVIGLLIFNFKDN